MPVTSSFQTQYLFGLPLAQDLPSVQAISRCHSFFTSKGKVFCTSDSGVTWKCIEHKEKASNRRTRKEFSQIRRHKKMRHTLVIESVDRHFHCYCLCTIFCQTIFSSTLVKASAFTSAVAFVTSCLCVYLFDIFNSSSFKTKVTKFGGCSVHCLMVPSAMFHVNLSTSRRAFGI